MLPKCETEIALLNSDYKDKTHLIALKYRVKLHEKYEVIKFESSTCKLKRSRQNLHFIILTEKIISIKS